MKSAEIKVGTYYAVTTWLSRKRQPNPKHLTKAKVTKVEGGKATLSAYPYEVNVKNVLWTWAENKRLLAADKAYKDEALQEALAARAELEKYLPAEVFSEGVNDVDFEYEAPGPLARKYEPEAYADGSGVAGTKETVYLETMVEVVKAAYEKGKAEAAASWAQNQREMSS